MVYAVTGYANPLCKIMLPGKVHFSDTDFTFSNTLQYIDNLV